MGPTSFPAAEPVYIFYSYSHRDARYREALQAGLAGLERQKLVRGWYDGHIKAGGEWKKEIADQLTSADVVLLLISPWFGASDFCLKEMEHALERYDMGEARVVPVLVRPFEWRDAPYLKLNHLPTNGKPITKWRNKEDAYFLIAKGLWELIVDRPFYNVPALSAPFVGREREFEQVRKLLVERRERAICLHGPAGVGKTRLAIRLGEELARRFLNGVGFISREQLRDSPSLAAAIARVLGIKEVRENPLDNTLRHYLECKQMLLILDGLEDPGADGEWLAELLAFCPRLQVLMTSRKELRVQGEVGCRLQKALTPREAAELFSEHAEAAPSRKTIESLCKDLGGHALAIEVAARADRPEEIGDSRRKPARGPSSWPRALRTAVSGGLLQLSPAQRKLFSRLSVFTASWTAEAADGICNAARDPELGGMREELGHLVKKGFLKREPEGGERYKMPDTFRELAAADLGFEEEELRRRHARFYMELAEKLEPRLTSAGRDGLLERLETENANFRAALAWCRTEREAAEWGLRLGGSLFWFWNLRGHFSEGRKWLEGALAQDGAGLTDARARALYAAGGLAFLQGDQEAALPRLRESVAIFRETGDRRRHGFALILLGMAEQQKDRFEQALACEHESIGIFRELRDEWGLALALNDLGNVYRASGDAGAAIELYRSSLYKWSRLGDRWGLALTLNNLGYMEMKQGELAVARMSFERALEVQSREDERWGLAETVKYLGDVALRQGRDEEAESRYRESLDMNRGIGRMPLILGCLAGLAVIAARNGQPETAARLSGCVDAFPRPQRPTSKPIDTEMYEPVVGRLRSSEHRRARSQGKRMGIEKITAWALLLPALAPPAAKPEDAAEEPESYELVSASSARNGSSKAGSPRIELEGL